MRYPNIKPAQGEQQDVNQRRYPDDNIELAGPQNPKEHDEYDQPGENAAANEPMNRPPAK